MKPIYLYVITNIIDNKQYVGVSIDPINRFNGHCKHQKYCIGRAIKNHGKENFKLEILNEIFQDRKLAHAKEIELIATLNTKAPNGYNLTKGGDGVDSEIITKSNLKRVLDGTHPFASSEGSKLFSDLWKNMSEDEYKRRCLLISDAQKTYWATFTPQERTKIISDRGKKRYSNPDERKRTSERGKKYYSNPKNRKKQSIAGMGKKKPGTGIALKKQWQSLSLEEQNFRKSKRINTRWAKWRRDNNKPPKPDDHLYLKDDK